ncbi:hypothetical protein [Parasitella parasitica]|uniref:Uncharacterized protein n=1 Tax=Parasitella parasitica TaxID=35722 RepID=A0A0B7N831_9FUNG|nr:hypothetical protein [Parasitella parasitica]
MESASLPPPHHHHNNSGSNNNSSSTSSLDQDEKYENELKQEIENLKKLALIKRQFLEEHKQQQQQQQQQQQTNKLATQKEKEEQTTVIQHHEEEDKLSPAESISLYTSHLGLIQNVLDEINQPGFVASVSAVANCETQSKRYHQALQNEIATQPYAQQRNESCTEWISLLGRLCQVLLQDGSIGKTAGRVLELLLSSADTRIPISTLQEVSSYCDVDITQVLILVWFVQEFPSVSENRHNIAKTTLCLLAANIIEINETDVVLLF